jgi:propanol-preferring alcohol dehydrogenase
MDRELPDPGRGQLRIKVHACGICHTDLHIVEGEITPPQLPITPGHQVIGRVDAVGVDVAGWNVGDLAGVPWLYQACGACEHCMRAEQNLCENARFTGFDEHGGYAEWMISDAGYTLHLSPDTKPAEAAPLLCAGIIGYRALMKSDLQGGERLGLIGFGASAHIAIQIARYWECEVYVFTRSEAHRTLAEKLGAAWVGGSQDDPPRLLDRAVLFAPVGDLVPLSLAKLRRGGTLAINAIHLSPIPEMQYGLIYGERTLRSVANATFEDGVALLKLAGEIPIKTTIQTYQLDDANQALLDLKRSLINGAGVLTT